VERATNERRRACWRVPVWGGSGFCIVSMATPPDVLSNYHLVLPHATPSRRHSEALPRPTMLVLRPPKRANERTKGEAGYKAMVTSADFSQQLANPAHESSQCTHLRPPTRREGRQETFNSLFSEMKNSGAPRERRPMTVHGLLAAIVPWIGDESESSSFRNLPFPGDSFFFGDARAFPPLNASFHESVGRNGISCLSRTIRISITLRNRLGCI